jgi:hypothetical protein
MEETHPAAVKQLPPFITGPGETDVLFIATVVLLIGIVLIVGNLYFRFLKKVGNLYSRLLKGGSGARVGPINKKVGSAKNDTPDILEH